MAVYSGPNIVTDKLKIYIDAANRESYTGVGSIPAKSKSELSTGWVDTGGNTAHHTAIGTDGVKLHNTIEDTWIGNFDFVTTSTGWHTMVFEYQSDGATTTQVEVNDDGGTNGTNNQFYDHVQATTTKQVYNKTANIAASTWSKFYFRRETDSGANVWITNFRLYESDSSGNFRNVFDLTGNGNDMTLTTATMPSWNSDGYFHFDGSGERDGDPLGEYLYGGWGGDNGITSSQMNPNNSSGGITWSWWSRITSAQTYGQGFLVQYGTVGHMEFKNEGTASPYFRTEARLGNGYSFSGNATIPGGSLVGRWSHFSLVINNSTSPRYAYWYHNGSNYATISMDGSSDGANQYFAVARIGSSTGTSSYQYSQSFWGDMSILQFYGKPLSAAEVLQNYNAHKGRHGH